MIPRSISPRPPHDSTPHDFVLPRKTELQVQQPSPVAAASAPSASRRMTDGRNDVRNRDAASIVKLGRLVVDFRHAKTSESSAGRIGLPRPESVGGRTAVVSQGKGLRGVRADHAGGARAAPDAAACLVRDAESLAFGNMREPSPASGRIRTLPRLIVFRVCLPLVSCENSNSIRTTIPEINSRSSPGSAAFRDSLSVRNSSSAASTTWSRSRAECVSVRPGLSNCCCSWSRSCRN